jgi:glucosamine-6-phosphate deaminase
MEKTPVKIYEDSKTAAICVAGHIAELIGQRAKQGKKTVLGLATGHTPVGVYRELIRLHKEKGLDFSNVITFNLDEYWPMDPASLQSYHRWMNDNLFNHINIPKQNIHIPSGTIPEDQIDNYCRQYEDDIKKAGGIDIQILGVGRTGHIGFNEPGSSQSSRTRRVQLDKVTIVDAASDFFGEENVPKMAITMGVGTVMDAREIVLLSFGEHKASIIKTAVEGEISSEIAASFLQEHPKCTFHLDLASADKLTRISTPWLSGICEWDDLLERQAVIWLAKKANKPILKLTDENYAENGLQQLLKIRGDAYDINLRVFRRMMSTITGWPGGKEGSKKVLILSPHPDDDVICMAGTMMRLVEQGHDVHTAYMVSGALAVFDHNVQRHAEFVKEFNRIFGLIPEQTSKIEQQIEQYINNKKQGELDKPEIQEIKALIRKTEAIAAAKFCGLQDNQIHFLDMPFYNTGTVQKMSITPKDISSVHELLKKIKPDLIFAAGDMSDPHGTHRLCLEAFLKAFEDYSKAENRTIDILLYRGAWEEWKPEQIDTVVPLSPDELKRKRFSIFRHESQKDKAMFPGPYDSREFWQRAEERNKTSAITYDELGLPEYEALEAFVRYPIHIPAYIKMQLSMKNDKNLQ